MLAILTQQPHDSGPCPARSPAQPEAAQQQSAGSITGSPDHTNICTHAVLCEGHTFHSLKPARLHAGVARPASQTGRSAVKRRLPAGVRAPKVGMSSKFRGVTKHSTTGRYEAHLWDSSSIRPKTVPRLRVAHACQMRPLLQLCYRLVPGGLTVHASIAAQQQGGRARGRQVYLGGYATEVSWGLQCHNVA